MPGEVFSDMRKKDVYGQSILFILLIVGIGLLRYVVEQRLKLPYGCLIYMIYITFFFQWMYRARWLFPQKNARRCITVFCVLLVFFQRAPHHQMGFRGL